MSSKSVKFTDKDVVILIPENWKKTPLDCPVCKTAFRNLEDVINWEKHGCCTACDLKFRYPNKEKWKLGWRPNQTSEKHH
jgi:hypothetical protein